ncbi:MAG: carboxypeptidase regulatory-like domain-containing protein [Melioribacteraceae bacterium]|nr:carboxypeptidase regulatory-like domain-containing protein [Melioribacteraceae bacterium]
MAIIIFILSCSEDPASPVDPETHGTITGIIIEEHSHNVLSNVNVFSNPATSFVTTDELGIYGIKSVLPGEYTMYATQTDYDTMSVIISVIAGNETIANFTMKVEDSSKTQIYGLIQGSVRNKANDLPIANTAIRTSPATNSISTDEFGQFTLLNIPAGEYQVYAEKSNFDITTLSINVVNGLSSTADFFLNEQDTSSSKVYGDIAGRILDAKTGSAIEGAVITTSPSTSSVTSNELGDYTIDNLNPAEYTILVTKYGYQSATTIVNVLVGFNTNADISLTEQSTGSVAGIVRDATTGNPIRGVSITTDPGTSSVTTDSLGSYTLVNLTPSNYSIIADKMGFVSTQVSVLVIAEETTTADITLQSE